MNYFTHDTFSITSLSGRRSKSPTTPPITIKAANTAPAQTIRIEQAPMVLAPTPNKKA